MTFARFLKDNQTLCDMISHMEPMQAAGPEAHESSGEEGHIQLYGWDSPTEAWNGPTGLNLSRRAPRRLLQALQATPGQSWFGLVRCGAPREEPNRFFSLVHATVRRDDLLQRFVERSCRNPWRS